MSDFPAPWVFLIVTLASYKTTWLVVFSSLMGSNLDSGTKWAQRLDDWAFNPDGTERSHWRAKVAIGLSCVHCVGWWVSLALVCLLSLAWPWQLGVTGWLVAGSVWAAQAILSVLDAKYLA